VELKKSGNGLGEKRTCSMASGKKYRIEFAPAATRQLEKLPRDVQVRLSRKIDTLAERPRPEGVKSSKVTLVCIGFGSATTASSTQFKTNCFWSWS
jgi:hypothetical protein